MTLKDKLQALAIIEANVLEMTVSSFRLQQLLQTYRELHTQPPKIVIEVSDGVVVGAYTVGNAIINPEMLIVDLDGAAVGEETVAEPIEVEPLENASESVIDTVKQYEHTTSNC